jgi:NAD(P)H-dependent FMN reductase
MKSILAFSGSNSSKSVNRKLLELACSKFSFVKVTLVDLRDYPLPIYSADIEEASGIPEEAIRLKKLFEQHDGLVIASPEHNGMMPAFLKNTMDWLSRAGGTILQEKPVMLMSVSPGPRGGATNLNNMKTLFPYWGASAVFADFSLGSFYQKFDMATGILTDAEDEESLNAAVQTFEAHFSA